VAYTANVTFSMTHMEVPQINLLTKVDLLINAPKKDKLPIPFDFYTDYRNVSDLLNASESDGSVFSQKHKSIIRALAGINETYGLVAYLPCTLMDKCFLQLILYQLDRAFGYCPEAPDEEFKMAMAVLKQSKTEKDLERAIDDLLLRCHKPSKQKST
jgi:hypothetical protein